MAVARESVRRRKKPAFRNTRSKEGWKGQTRGTRSGKNGKIEI
jgi:hypothetical protein